MVSGMSKPRRLAAASVLALAIAGCSAAPPAPSPTTDPTTTGGLATGTPRPSDSATRSPQRPSPFAGLAGYLSHRQGVVTAAVYDRRTGRTSIYHRGIRQHTASIFKVEIMGTALRQAEAAGRALPAAYRALIQAMIENSNNDAATSMLAKVGGPGAVKRFDLLAGLTDTTPSRLKYIPGTALAGWGLTTTTALDEVRLVKRFAYPNSLLSAASRRYGLNLMEHVESDQAWGVSGGTSGGLPSGTTVALKNGWLPLANSGWQVNSIGWVSGHGRDYVLAVLTNHSPSFQSGIDTVDGIARLVFRALAPGPGGST